MTTERPDLDAACLDVHAAIEEPYRSTVASNARADVGVDETVAQTRAAAGVTFASQPKDFIPLPPGQPEDRADDYREVVWGSAEESYGSGDVPDARAVVGALLEAAKRAVERTEPLLQRAQQHLGVARTALGEYAEELAISGRGTVPGLRSLRAQIGGGTMLIVLAFLIESSALMRALLGKAGVTIDSAPASVLVTAALTACGCSVVSITVLHILAKLIRRAGLSTVLLRVGVWVLGLLFVVFVGALASMRFFAELPEDALSAAINTVSAGAEYIVTYVVIGFSPVSILLLKQWLAPRLAALREGVAQEREAAQARQRREEQVAYYEKEVARLTEIIERPAAIEQVFVLGVRRCWAKRDAFEHELKALELRVRAAYAICKKLKPGMSTAVRNSLSSLVEVSQSATRAGKNGALLGLCLCIAPAMMSCERKLDPGVDRYVVCDVTGTEPGCSLDVLSRSFVAWARANSRSPGARFVVVKSDRDLASTRVTFRSVVPKKWRGSVRVGRSTWIRKELGRLAKLDLTPPTSPRQNRSDLPAALVVVGRDAAAFAQTGTPRPARLLIASDGWFVSRGVVNLERTRRSRTVEKVLRALQRHKLLPDLSVFASVTVCGVSTLNGTPGRIALRDAVLRRLVSPKAPDTIALLGSCLDILPLLPAGYAAR